MKTRDHQDQREGQREKLLDEVHFAGSAALDGSLEELTESENSVELVRKQKYKRQI